MDITLVTQQEADEAGMNEDRVLIEQTPDHYAEFAEFITEEMDRADGSLFFRGASGLVYRVGKVKGGESDPVQGIEICVRVPEDADAPSTENVSSDLWDFVEWIVQSVGSPWEVGVLRKVGAIYKIPGAPARA
jgi:hypothetical protein